MKITEMEASAAPIVEIKITCKGESCNMLGAGVVNRGVGSVKTFPICCCW
jgi:hypothetical protein